MEGEGGGVGREVTRTRQQRQRERRLKLTLLVLLRDYSNSFNLYNVAELSSHRTSGNDVQAEAENENLLSCPNILHKTLNLIISRCCLAEYNEERCENL